MYFEARALFAAGLSFGAALSMPRWAAGRLCRVAAGRDML